MSMPIQQEIDIAEDFRLVDSSSYTQGGTMCLSASSAGIACASRSNESELFEGKELLRVQAIQLSTDLDEILLTVVEVGVALHRATKLDRAGRRPLLPIPARKWRLISTSSPNRLPQ
jgi:hypothetical protein